MGYSASTPMKSTKARDEMIAFLEEHYRPWLDVQPTGIEDGMLNSYMTSEDYDWSTHICTGEELAYNPGKLKVGFNFSHSGGILGHYGFSILRWMALRAGKTRKVSQKEFPGLKGSFPVFQYDYDPAWPVLPRSQYEGNVPKKVEWCLTDDNGFKPYRRPWDGPMPLPEREEEVLVSVTLLSAPKAGMVVGKLQRILGISKSEAWDIVNNVPYTWEDETVARNIEFGLGGRCPLKRTHETRKYKAGELSGVLAMVVEVEEPIIQACEKAIMAELQRLTDLWEAR